MTDINLKIQCTRCLGTGIDDNTNPPSTCVPCGGTGWRNKDKIEVTDLVTKIDAIKAMLDSTVCGLQKMSSNLDDIMVKLDV